jgi:transposase
MDIIVSYIAWGFHFPLITYLDNVIKLMHNNTILIIDVRHASETLANDNTEKLISEYFKIINKKEGKKSDRYIFKLK